MTKAVNQAELEWQDGQPYSKAFGDIYFSRESGVDETRFVFLQHNQLQERWRSLSENSHFVIGETGFGTGLSFLCAWQLWLETAPQNSCLHFVSTELYPLSEADMLCALNLWPEFSTQINELMQQYKLLTPGWHRMIFAGGRVMLTLVVGDVRDTLPQIKASVDAWFLDGFAPAKNPEMWGEGLFKTIAEISAPDATFSTFTSAGAIRRGLQAAGFKVEKAAGYGLKREILCGKLDGSSSTLATKEKHAIVIGGGIAGCASAHSLAIRGWKVTLIERHPSLAAEASGNHQGVLYARLSPKNSNINTLTLASYLFTLRRIPLLLAQAEDNWQQCGVLQLAFSEAESLRQRALVQQGFPTELLHAVTMEQASSLAGVKLQSGGVYFPTGGWVFPRALCKSLTQSSEISIVQGEVTEIRPLGDQWQAWHGGDLLATATVIVVAGATVTNRFSQTAHLPLRSVRGQVSHLPVNHLSGHLKSVVCGDGYVAPQRQGIHTLGSTYQDGDVSMDVREQDHVENLGILQQLSPSLHASLADSPVAGRAASRCSVPSNLPVIGEVSAGCQGIYVNTGHSSRGLVTTLLAGEVLAAYLTNEPMPISQEIIKAISPLRFNQNS